MSESAPDAAAQTPRSLLITLRNRIFTGLLLAIPLVVTVWVVAKAYKLATAWAYNWIIHQPFSGVFAVDGRFPFWFGGLVRIFALFLLLLLLLLVGELAQHAIFRRALKSLEALLVRLPLVKVIYMTSKQILDAVSKPGGGIFRQVVLFEHPRPGIWVIGFITNEDSGKSGFSGKVGRDLYSVFLPTTPNPTSGFLLFIPKADCIPVDLSVTDAMRLIISGGAISPEALLAPPQPPTEGPG
jgi:uncharacterized membrane protein